MPARNRSKSRRRICFVTGTRAEFGLMRLALETISSHPRLTLQLVATGMHLDPVHGNSLADIRAAGFPMDAVVPWPAAVGLRATTMSAMSTGQAIATLAIAYERLDPDVVLIVGDRVEAFAAAVAAHLSHRCLAHVHGGDRALGQLDDALRHAITKLAHLHFPATAQSARRILRLGEDPSCIHRIGSPGLDGIEESAARWDQLASLFPELAPGRFALLVLHPVDANAEADYRRARLVLGSIRRVGFDEVVVIYPNNDPGSAGITRCWDGHSGKPGLSFHRNLTRPLFLGLMRDAAVLVGNSSSGIIEAASFGMPVLDIGPRQEGRERSRNVVHCEYDAAEITRVLRRLWNGGKPKRVRCLNVYGTGDASHRMADILARVPLHQNRLGKLIRY
jgi:UDP-hydrolysing UDP-N-acetyl-D-glucosamine 2-epimerase